MNLELAGKVALVSGGSKGMGRSIALALADEGARVAIVARGADGLETARREIESRGADALAIVADVSRSDDVEGAVQQTAEHFNAIDVLVTNAGGPPAKRFEQTTEEDWRQAQELTLFSVVRLIRASLPFLERTRGAIVTINSISVKQPVAGLVLSNAIRPSVIGLAKSLADELGPRGVRINNILPGMIMTDRSRELARHRAETSGKTEEDIFRETAAAIPLGRYGHPDEVAALALFLASPRSSYLTGTSILCDGGLYRGLL